MSIVIYLVAMALTTYLIRMIPFTAFRKQIRSEFLRSFLYYVPFAVLGAMTFPAVFYSTGNVITAIAGTLVAVILALFNRSLIIVALSAVLTAFITGIFLP
ncbi:MAG: AzlD domain-containing protein [Clostridia bacterium]|nr:AzlD domain-containing protein [Clostridia bacterium]